MDAGYRSPSASTGLTMMGESSGHFVDEEEEEIVQKQCRTNEPVWHDPLRPEENVNHREGTEPAQSNQSRSRIRPNSSMARTNSAGKKVSFEEQRSEPLRRELLKTPSVSQWNKPVSIRKPKSLVRRFRLLCGHFVEQSRVQLFIVTLIILNAIIMGVATFDFVTDDPSTDKIFDKIDQTFLVIFTFELMLHLIYRGLSLFLDGWLVFDFVIVVVSWSLESFQIIRAFRVFRALRLVTRIESLRDLILALGSVMPNLSAIMCLLSLIFYVFAVLFTELFRDVDLEQNYFGSLDYSLFSCMQLMTLEDWGNVARDVALQKGPSARVPFVAFISLSGFIVFNLIVAVVCDAVSVVERMKHAKEEDDKESEEEHDLSEKLNAAQERILHLSFTVDEMRERNREILEALQTLSEQVGAPVDPTAELSAQLELARHRPETELNPILGREVGKTLKQIPEQEDNSDSLSRNTLGSPKSKESSIGNGHIYPDSPHSHVSGLSDVFDSPLLNDEEAKDPALRELAAKFKPMIGEARSILRMRPDFLDDGAVSVESDDDLDQELERLRSTDQDLRAQLSVAPNDHGSHSNGQDK